MTDTADKKWPDSMQPATPLVPRNMSERERAEAEEAERLAAMSDSEVAEKIRAYLTRTFIGRGTVNRDIIKDDGSPGTITVRRPHRYVEFFDRLVRQAGGS